MSNEKNPAKKLIKDIHQLEKQMGIRGTLIQIPRSIALDLTGMDRNGWLESSNFPPSNQFIEDTLNRTDREGATGLSGIRLGHVVISVEARVENDVEQITIIETDTHLTEDAILWCIDKGVEFPKPSNTLANGAFMSFVSNISRTVNILIDRGIIAYQGHKGTKIPEGATVLHSKDFSIL